MLKMFFFFSTELSFKYAKKQIKNRMKRRVRAINSLYDYKPFSNLYYFKPWTF